MWVGVWRCSEKKTESSAEAGLVRTSDWPLRDQLEDPAGVSVKPMKTSLE